MKYLSPEIAFFAKNKKRTEKSLITKSNSCGIFQDYGLEEEHEKE